MCYEASKELIIAPVKHVISISFKMFSQPLSLRTHIRLRTQLRPHTHLCPHTHLPYSIYPIYPVSLYTHPPYIPTFPIYPHSGDKKGKCDMHERKGIWRSNSHLDRLVFSISTIHRVNISRCFIVSEYATSSQNSYVHEQFRSELLIILKRTQHTSKEIIM